MKRAWARTRFVLLVLLVLLGTTAWAQDTIGSWSLGEWTDPATEAARPAIWSATDYGLDGEVVFACDDASELGLTLVLSADAMAADTGDPVLVGAKFDTDPELGPWTGWSRGTEGSYVRFGGDASELQLILDEMADAVSPVFMVAFGSIEEGFHMFVLESEAFASALAALPCSS